MKGILRNLFVLLLLCQVSVAWSEDKPAMQDTLYQNFLNPPHEARPRVWWHWMNGNITKDGIRKDILWMHRAGIGGFHNFDAGLSTPQIVNERLVYMTPAWKEAFRYALSLADSLGMEVATASAAGWSNTGGPWVKPENAMKKLVWRELRVKGQKSMDVQLPAPYTTTGEFQNRDLDKKNAYYKDISVIAVRLSKDDQTMAEMQAKVTSSGGNFTLGQLTDGNLTNAVELPRDDQQGYAWIQYEFKKPQTIKALTVVDGLHRTRWHSLPPPVTKHLEASHDGIIFWKVCDIPHGGAWQQTITIPETTAKFFRMTVDNPVRQSTASTGISEFVLYPEVKVNHFEEKTGFASPYDLEKYPTPTEGVVAATDVVDLTQQLTPDGHLRCSLPKGNWVIYRFGYSLTGKKNGPASPEATGLEVDKMDAAAVNDYIEQYLAMYEEAAGGLMGDRGLRYILIDSYEAGCQTWTPRMVTEFERRRGYSMLTWMPVLAGRVIESAEKSEQFLWDWRKTIGELITENLYGQIGRVLAEHHLDSYYEAHENSRQYMADGMSVKSKANIPMAAIWMMGDTGEELDSRMYESDIRESASVAHIYDKKYVAGETFTVSGNMKPAWSYYPGNLKPTADRALSSGLNRFVIHESAHQPVDDKVPGLGLGEYGQWFNRHETWAEQARAWTDYLARSSYLLQQGENVADVLYYYGEDNNPTGLYAHGHPDVPAGFNYDYIHAEGLVKDMTTADGMLVAPSGVRYRLLAVDANARRMSLPVLRKLAELVDKGIVICGQKPETDPSMSDDQEEFRTLCRQIWGTDAPRKNVLTGMTVGEALQTMGIRPDFHTDDMQGMRYVHRRLADAEVYWVCNRTDKPRRLKAAFRTSGLLPMLWHPETGRAEQVSYSMADGETIVGLNLVADDAVFVVFRGKTDARELRLPEQTATVLKEVGTPWTVRFQQGRGAPKEVVFNELVSYTDKDDKGIKYFSGTATYLNTVHLTASDLNQGQLLLDLGQVGVMAEVQVNGKNLGVLWKSPYVVDVTDAVREGDNLLEFKVVNLWPNRLIGDQQPDCPKKYTYTARKFYNANSPLFPSGLMGPVVLKSVR